MEKQKRVVWVRKEKFLRSVRVSITITIITLNGKKLRSDNECALQISVASGGLAYYLGSKEIVLPFTSGFYVKDRNKMIKKASDLSSSEEVN